MNNIFKRVSIRKFKDLKVEEEKIEQLLRAAMQSPSACNGQPWEFAVVENKELIEKLSTVTPYVKFVKDAPLVIVPLMRKENRFRQFEYMDLGACSLSILLEAVDLGLGGTWCAVASSEIAEKRVSTVLSIEDTLTPFSIIAIGYPSEDRPQISRYDINRVHNYK